jgi:hypothetical protein
MSMGVARILKGVVVFSKSRTFTINFKEFILTPSLPPGKDAASLRLLV